MKYGRLLVKVILVLIVALLGFDAYIIYNHGFIRHNKASEKLGAIVRLAENGRTFCSGTVIATNAILTAAHCVLIGQELGLPLRRRGIEIRPADGSNVETTAEVYEIRYQMDQAVLQGDFSKFQILPFIPEVEKLTDKKILDKKMTACGYPLGGPFFCTTIHFRQLEQFMWQVDGVLIPGMSGGPVMLENGAIVATNDAVEGDHAIVSPIYNLDFDLPEEE